MSLIEHSSYTNQDEEPLNDGLTSFEQWAKGEGEIWGEHSRMILSGQEIEVHELPMEDLGSTALHAVTVTFY